jgi:hypothetical protein
VEKPVENLLVKNAVFVSEKSRKNTFFKGFSLSTLHALGVECCACFPFGILFPLL